MPVEPPVHIQNRIDQWWRRWGFSDNPFARAVSEEQFYPHFFVDTGKFEWIYGNPEKPSTILFFAGRGCGKTAHRLKLESDCGPLLPDSPVLAIVYSKFDEWHRPNGAPMVEDHLNLILRQGLSVIFKTVAALPGEQIDALPDIFYALIKPLCDYIDPQQTIGRIERGLGLPVMNTALDRTAFARFQIRLRDERLLPYAHPPSYYQTMMEYLEAARLLGYLAVYVLVDSVDEIQLQPPLTWMDCLEPLLSDLNLMRLPGLAFKFFLPAEKRDDLLSKEFVRSDKLEHAELVWSAEDLSILLMNRLRAFNSASIDSLRMMCEPKLAACIDDGLVEQSLGVPRNLLNLARYLIQIHCTNQEGRTLITMPEWEQTVYDLKSSHDFIPPVTRVPELVISQRSVFIGSQYVKLSRNELAMLWGMAVNLGRFSKDELVAHVFGSGEGVSDDAISGLVKRLRDKLGDQSENPKYIRTLHGTGFELCNWKMKED